MNAARRGLLRFIACALAPGLPVIAFDAQARYGFTFILEELVPDSDWLGDAYRAIVEVDGQRVFVVGLVAEGAWANLQTREAVRADVRHQVAAHVAMRDRKQKELV